MRRLHKLEQVGEEKVKRMLDVLSCMHQKNYVQFFRTRFL